MAGWRAYRAGILRILSSCPTSGATALRLTVLGALSVLALSDPARAAGAQRVGPAGAALHPPLVRDSARVPHAPLFTARDAYAAAAFTAATVALFPVDQRIAERLHRPAVQAHAALDHAATGVELLAVPGAFLASGAAYAVGRVGHHERLADVGLHVGGATAFATGVTLILKSAAGRSRPYVSADSSPRDFGFGRGLTRGEDYSAFPSGHATVAFAAASALTSETMRWWPRATRYVAPLTYGGATTVALARMYHDKHWASDVVLGAAIGTFSGLGVVRYQHTHPGNRIDRWFLAPSAAPDGHGGGAVAWSVSFR